MQQNIPLIFDRALLRRRRARAAAAFSRHDFLHRAAAMMLLERRGDTLRDLPRVLVMGGQDGLLIPALQAQGDFVVAADSAPECLPPPPLPRVAMDEEWLPCAPESFDLLISNLMLQSVNDLPGALLQCRRILAPGGLFLAALLGGSTLTELRQCFYQAEQELMGGVSPRVAPPIALDSAAALLQRAGFSLPVADSQMMTAHYTDALALMRDLRGMGLTNILHDRLSRPTPRAVFARVAALYAARFPAPPGGITASFELIFLHGWAPSSA